MLRRTYLDRIRPYFHSEQIKAIVGSRRAGKSTIMKQIIEELSLSVSRDRIVYFDFEDYEMSIYLDDPKRFYQKVKNYIQGKERCYIFLDEIHHMEDYERVLASIRSSLGASIFVTSSDSNLLMGSLATVLTGRYISFNVLPFQYSEVLECKNTEDSDEEFLSYMDKGGFPLVYAESFLDTKEYLTELYDAIIKNDIVRSHEIRNPGQLKRFAAFVLVHSGEIISSESITGHVRSTSEEITVQSCYKYLKCLEEAFLVQKCSRYDIKGKALLDSKSKYYAVDPGFININEGSADINKAFILETIVYNELRFRNYEVHVGKTYNGEVDFVVLDGKKKCYIQVCYLLGSEETVKREFGAFSSIKDASPRYVLSLDKLNFSHDGITNMNIRDFLTRRKELILL